VKSPPTPDHYLRSWNGMRSLYTLQPKGLKSKILNDPSVVETMRKPIPPPWFHLVKPLRWRGSPIDHTKCVNSYPIGHGEFGFLQLNATKLHIQRTCSFKLAWTKNSHVLDFSTPREISGNTTVIPFLKWRLFKLLELFSIFVSRNNSNSKKSKWLIGISLQIRRHLVTMKYGKAFKILNSLRLRSLSRETQLTVSVKGAWKEKPKKRARKAKPSVISSKAGAKPRNSKQLYSRKR